MEKRLVLAIALSILVIFSFQYYFGKTLPARAPASPAVTETLDTRQKTAVEEADITAPRADLAEEAECVAGTAKYELIFSNLGGAIKEIQLKDFKTNGGESSLVLASINDPREYILSIEDPLGRLGFNNAVYELTKGDGGSLTYTFKSGNIEVAKKYILHNFKHIIELQIIVKNTGDTAQDLSYRIISGSGIIEPSLQDKRFVEVTSKIDGKIQGFKRPKGNRIINKGSVSWVALKNKYFSLILKPLAQTKAQFYEDTRGNLTAGVDIQDTTLPPHSFVQHNYTLYAGPSDMKELQSVGLGFEETINYGVFGFISHMLLAVLKFSYKIFHNWGVSIIVLSILLNIILFPLTNKSFKSMQKMQSLQPQMEKLKTQFKDNPQKLNKEIMELYKKYNINPLSGCLPLLLQMPIFIALYQALSRSVDLKNANFLWIKDLSLPDALKLPFTLPLVGNAINILPILMAISMVVQQKISNAAMGAAQTEEQKQQQKMMMVIMPVMFGFIFYNMPSGLVLYWFLNTLLTVIEQALIFKRAK